MTRIRITESGLKKMVGDAVRKVLHETFVYRMSSPDELMGYSLLRPSFTGLPVDIFVDDGKSYVRDHHVPLLFIRNGHSDEDRDFLAMSLSEDPQPMFSAEDSQLTKGELNAVESFVRLNYEALMLYADGRINPIELKNAIQIPSVSMVGESSILAEMATVKKADSGLPVDLWIDEGKTYVGHAPRIKFKASNEQHTTHDFSTITITDPPIVENLPRRPLIKKREIDVIRRFVIDNMEDLRKVADGEMDYTTEFFPKMLANRQKYITKKQR